MTNPAPLTLDDVARRIGQSPERLTADLDPADGLRVWPGGLATVHAGGKIRMLVQDRRVHTVVCSHDPDPPDLQQYPVVGRSPGVRP